MHFRFARPLHIQQVTGGEFRGGLADLANGMGQKFVNVLGATGGDLSRGGDFGFKHKFLGIKQVWDWNNSAILTKALGKASGLACPPAGKIQDIGWDKISPQLILLPFVRYKR